MPRPQRKRKSRKIYDPDAITFLSEEANANAAVALRPIDRMRRLRVRDVLDAPRWAPKKKRGKRPFHDPEGLWADEGKKNAAGKGPEKYLVESEAHSDARSMVSIYDVNRNLRKWIPRNAALKTYAESYRIFRQGIRAYTNDTDEYDISADDPFKRTINANITAAIMAQREKRAGAAGALGRNGTLRFMVLDSGDFGTTDSLAAMLPEGERVYTRIDVANPYGYEDMVVTPTNLTRKHYPVLFRNPVSYLINYKGNDRDAGVYEAILLDYCSTYRGNTLTRPREDIRDMFRNQLLCDYSVFGLTIAMRDPFQDKPTAKYRNKKGQTVKETFYLYNVSHAIAEIQMLAEAHGYTARYIFDDSCDINSLPSNRGSLVYRRANMAFLVFAIRKQT